ncbi:MAG: hypothetical protein EZS28_038646, partial [Streblomastix strix]
EDITETSNTYITAPGIEIKFVESEADILDEQPKNAIIEHENVGVIGKTALGSLLVEKTATDMQEGKTLEEILLEERTLTIKKLPDIQPLYEDISLRKKRVPTIRDFGASRIGKRKR